MKEFELQGDISSGFRWRIKGTMEAEREVFVPLGDSSGTARIQNDGEMSKPSEKEIASDPGYNRPYIPLKRPLTDKIKFDPDYEPLLASEREARRQLLATPVMLPPDILKAIFFLYWCGFAGHRRFREAPYFLRDRLVFSGLPARPRRRAERIGPVKISRQAFLFRLSMSPNAIFDCTNRSTSPLVGSGSPQTRHPKVK